MLEEVRTMLGVYIGDIFQDAVEVTECFFLEVFGKEQIWVPAFLILLDKSDEGH